MKKLARSYLVMLAAVFLVSQLILGFKVANLDGLLITALLLLGVKYIQKPIFTLLIFPKNLPFEFLLQAMLSGVLFYVLPIFLPQFRIRPFNFEGIFYKGVIIPSLQLDFLPTIAVSAILVSLIIFILEWLAE